MRGETLARYLDLDEAEKQRVLDFIRELLAARAEHREAKPLAR